MKKSTETPRLFEGLRGYKIIVKSCRLKYKNSPTIEIVGELETHLLHLSHPL